MKSVSRTYFIIVFSLFLFSCSQNPISSFFNKQQAKVATRLFQFDVSFEPRQIIDIMNQEGYRPAIENELRWFISADTTIEASCLIVALGTPGNGKFSNGNFYFCVDRFNGELEFGWANYKRYTCAQFLAINKKVDQIIGKTK